MPESRLLFPGCAATIRPGGRTRPQGDDPATLCAHRQLRKSRETPAGRGRDDQRAFPRTRLMKSTIGLPRADVRHRFGHLTHHMHAPSRPRRKMLQKTGRFTISSSCLILHHVADQARKAATFLCSCDWNCRQSMQLSRRKMFMLHRKTEAPERLAGGIKCGSTEATTMNCGTLSCRFGANGGSLYGRQKRNGDGQR